MTKTLTLLCWLSFCFGFAQKAKPTKPILQRQEPEFVGGVSALATFIMRNYHYPERMLKANVSGGTDVKFRVTERGTVDSIRILKSPGFGADEEAIRLIKLTSGKWK
ncbi:energy transducer TonB [Fibrella arboris]|uniref:energy transducer TonB n=1 Tax=Fibrella arboris TaxID=3242486 RepID=UPI003520E22C